MGILSNEAIQRGGCCRKPRLDAGTSLLNGQGTVTLRGSPETWPMLVQLGKQGWTCTLPTTQHLPSKAFRG